MDMPKRFKTTLTLALMQLLVFAQLAQTAAAASTDLASVPMAVLNTVKSNVVFTLDSSGGMDVDVLLPTYNSMYFESGVTAGNTPYTLNGNFYLFPAVSHPSWMGVMLEGDSGSFDTLHWRVRNYQYNPQFYNPFVAYQPWPGKDKNGNPFGDANPAAARLDPYDPAVGTMNLTQSVAYNAHTFLDPCGFDISLVSHTCSGTLYSAGGRYYPSTLFPAMYYVWNDANHNGVMDAGEGTRYLIQPGTPSYPNGNSYAQELQNFANWFQYYRTVMLNLKGSIGKQLATMGSARVGMTDLAHASLVSPVVDMSVSGNVDALRAQIYAIKPNLNDWRQPIHERLYNVASYYKQTGANAPIQYACQQNFDILATPGYLNENGPGAAGFTNYFTGVTPPSIGAGNYDGSAAAPYADSYSNTLADWVLYYYDQNLRPDLATGQVPIPPGTHETNTNPHMTTYVVAPGAAPLLAGPPRNLNPASVDPWSINPAISWPQPAFVDQSTIDDLWHAAVNGRGVFINTPDIYSGLSAILSDVLARTGAAAAVAVSNANVVPGDNFSYASSYNSGNWSGALQAYPVNLTTGQPNLSAPVWTAGSAQAQLDALAWSSRAIATYSGAAGISFQWASLSASQQALLNSPTTPPGPSDGAAVLSYLRGNRSSEGSMYRTRAHVLGDVVDAEPVIVREPNQGYFDNGYAAYKSANAARTKMVYQAANDGMLHAFNAATGAESWAYLPGLLFNSRLSSNPGSSALVNLTLKTGFTHLYYVDGTPTAGDVNMSNTSAYTLAAPPAPNWRTILVGGLRLGGRGYYALDVTSPAASNDADVAAKVLWEFPNNGTSAAVAKNVGFSFGKPVIVKTAAAGWVVLVTSGYNNGSDTGGDGQGHLFVLDARTGALLKDIATGVGSPATASGLAQTSAFVVNGAVDATAQYVYGGDLLGNVWRFDLTGSSMPHWSVTRLATLVDAASTPQPVTTAPELSIVNGNRMVYVGTGQYLGNSDVTGSVGSNYSANHTQSMYGLKDDLTATPLITNLRGGSLIQQTVTSNGNTRSITANAVDLSTMKGWYLDFPAAGEASVTDPAVALGALMFTTNLPSGANPCQPGGSSWLYVVDYRTGGLLNGSTVSWSATSLGNTLASRILAVRLPSGQMIDLVRQSDASTTTTAVSLPPFSSSGKRRSWREILTQ